VADNSGIIESLNQAIANLDGAEAAADNAIQAYKDQKVAIEAQCKAAQASLDAAIVQVQQQKAQAEAQEVQIRALLSVFQS
jgi:predicted  nucleic acid-binding Zn-ribbon protein